MLCTANKFGGHRIMFLQANVLIHFQHYGGEHWFK